jgi:flagellar motility protein MotE (MotC chaperone)
MHKTIVLLVALAVCSTYARGQDPSTQGTAPTSGPTPEEIRKNDIKTKSDQMRALIARKTFLEKLIAELSQEVKNLEIRTQAAKDRLTELQTALGNAQRSNGSNRAGNMRVSYDNSAEIQRITKLVSGAKADLTKISARLGKAQTERAEAENEILTIGFSLREQRIALTGMGVDVEPLLAAPATPKIARPAGPAAKKLFVTKDGRIISAASAEMKDGTWTITTIAGKTVEVESHEIEKIIEKN